MYKWQHALILCIYSWFAHVQGGHLLAIKFIALSQKQKKDVVFDDHFR